jgi:hypothetical protein
MRAGVQGLTRIQSRWDILRIYRVFVRGRLYDDGKDVIVAAYSAHRRFWFLLSLFLAVLLIGVQAAIRLCLLAFQTSLPHWEPVMLMVLFVSSTLLSSFIRYFAGRSWQEELVLTCGITRLRVRPV